MHRRSFLRGLMLAPIAAPFLAKAAAGAPGAITARPFNFEGISAISANFEPVAFKSSLCVDGYVSGVSMVSSGKTLTVSADQFAIDRAKEVLDEAYRSSPTPSELAASGYGSGIDDPDWLSIAGG